MRADRRAVVKHLSALPIVALAGCLGRGLEIESVSSKSTLTGNVIVTVRVTNNAPLNESAVLRATVDVQDGERYTQRRDITVTGSSSELLEISFELPFREIVSGFEYDYDATLD